MSARMPLWSGPPRRWRAEAKSPAVGPPKRIDVGVPNRAGASSKPLKQMRVLFVNQYYWPDHVSTAQHLTDLAESLAEQGCEVHVLCSRRGSRPGAETRPAREVRNGVTVHRVGATAFGRMTTLGRMSDYLSYHAGAMIRALSLPKFDIVVTLTTPPLVGLVGSTLRRFKKSWHVYWSMDLHPDASLALGRMSRKNPLVRGLIWLSDRLYRKADRVVALGPYMADRILAKRVKADRVVNIPVWSRKDEVYPLPREGHSLRGQLGLDDKFVVLYSGNLGLAHRFDEFLEAARRLRHRKDVVFLFVGDGPRLREVAGPKEAEGLDNVVLMDYFPREQLHASLSVADAHLISLRPEMTGVCVPGKLYGAMASGRPVLFVGPEHCETADAIRRADCGTTIRPEDPQAVVDAIERLAADPDLARDQGERAVSAFVGEYEREACCARWCWMLSELVGAPVEVVIETATAPVPMKTLASVGAGSRGA